MWKKKKTLSLTPTIRLKTIARCPPSTLYKLFPAAYNPIPITAPNFTNAEAAPPLGILGTFTLFRFIFPAAIEVQDSEDTTHQYTTKSILVTT